jgi:hypothetical protein
MRLMCEAPSGEGGSYEKFDHGPFILRGSADQEVAHLRVTASWPVLTLSNDVTRSK